MESKEQLSDPNLLPIHHQHLQLDHNHDVTLVEQRKRKHSSLLPAIRPHQPRNQHSTQPAHLTPSTLRRPHSADSSLHSLAPPALVPLFSSSHRVTAGGSIIHVSNEDAMAGPVVEVEGREVDATAGGVVGAGRERIIWLEPIGVKAKVDSGLRRHEEEDGGAMEETTLQQVNRRSEEDRKQRRRQRTEQRRQERLRQQQEQQQQQQDSQSVTAQRAEEEKIQTESEQQLTVSTGEWKAIVERRRRQGELNDALASLVLERAANNDMSASLISANIQAGLYEAVMAATDLGQLLSARGRASLTGADDSKVAFGELSLDELRSNSRRSNHHRHRRRKKGANAGDGGLVWSDHVQPSSLLPDEQPEWTYSSRVNVGQPDSDSSDEEDDDGEGEGGSDEDDSRDVFDSSDSVYSSDDGSERDAEHDDKLTAEQRVGIALNRMQQGSRPPTSQMDSASPSRPASASSASATRPTSASQASHPSRPTSASSASRTAHTTGNGRTTAASVTFATTANHRSRKNKSHRKQPTTTADSATPGTASSSTTARNKKAGQLSTSTKSKKELETELLRVKQQREKGSSQSMFDQRPVVLSTGDAIDRSTVYSHHATDVQLVVDMMAELMGGNGTLALASPISIQSVAERAAGARGEEKVEGDVKSEAAAVMIARGGKGGKTADQPAPGGGARGGEAEKRKEGKNAPSTTVLHGKDMMIVSSWVMALARRYLAQVMGEKQYAEQPNAAKPPADTTDSAASSRDNPSAELVPVIKPAVPALERLSLDRRTLYNLGLTHERIDQIYSGLYAYSSGFYQLLYGFAQPNVPPTSTLSPALFLHRLWLAYLRLIELSHPALYLYTLAAVQRLSAEETDAAYNVHLKDVERSDVAVRNKREEVRVLKEEYGRTNELYEDTLDGVSEARVTLMAMRETNWREEQQLSEVSDEAIADLSAKANRALNAQQTTYDNNVRVRERRALIVKATNTARADIHLAHLHHDDMTRLIAERNGLIVQVQSELPRLQTRAEEAERCGREAAAVAAAIRLVSYQLLALNRQVLRITTQQVAVIAHVRQFGLTSLFEADEWPVILAEVAAAHEEAQLFLTEHVPGQSGALDGVDVVELERQARVLMGQQGQLTDELKAKMGLDVFEREMQQRVKAAQVIQADNTRMLASLTATIADYRSQLKDITAAYRLVYAENESYLLSNGKLQEQVDGLLARLEQLLPQQEVKRASIAASQASTDDMREQCAILPGKIEELRAATLALVPRQTELSAVEVTKGEVYRALQDEKDKLDREWVRSRRNEDELKAEMIELDAQLADMESKCQPLWQELDGKLGVLEREIEYKKREWENCGMRLCEEEKRIEWRVEAVQAAEERLHPVQQQLSDAQAAANEVRTLLEAEQAKQDAIRKEMRETREQMQAKTREKEEFLARHVKDNHELMDAKAAQLAHIAHLHDTLQHNKNELRASYSVNDQMMIAHDKRLQQWNTQLEARREALRKKREIDQQRKDVQAIKRAEMLEARDVVRTDCEKEQERQRELTELLAMTQHEWQQELATTAEMERTTERLQRLHVNLSSAAPHLQHELDRVTEKDRHFDVHEVERAVQEEMERQHELIQRLTQLEEEEWTRRLHRTERWIQTDPSRHFKSLKDVLADGSRERYVLGVEMGLMDNQWVSEKQREMEEEEELRAAETAARQRRSGISLHSPGSTSQLNSSRDASHSSHSHISPALAAHAASASSPGLSGVLPPAAQTWASSLRSSSNVPHAVGRGGRQSKHSVTSRQRAGSVSAVQANYSNTVPLDQSTPQSGKVRRGHARTQTMLPLGWQQSESIVPSNASTTSLAHHRASISAMSADTAAASYHRLSSSAADNSAAAQSFSSSLSSSADADTSPQGDRNLTSRSIAREQQARERERSAVNESEPRTVLSALLDSSRRSIRAPSPLQIEQPFTSHRSRSPLSPSRPRSAAAMMDDAIAALTPHFALQRPRSPQSAMGWSDDSTARTLSRPTTAQSGSRPGTSSLQSTLSTNSTSRLATSSRHERPSSAQRSRSPVPAGTQLDAASMIPDSAMRPVAVPNKGSRSTRHDLTLASQQQLQQLQASAGSVDWEQFTGRLRNASDRVEEAAEARNAEAAYDQFVGTTQPKPLREVVAVEKKAAPQPTPMGSPGLAAKRRAVVQIPSLPLQRTGTLSDWLEQQMRLSAEVESGEDDKRKQPTSSSQPLPLQHKLLALALPDQSQPAQQPPRVELEEAVSPPALMSGRRLAIVPEKATAPQTVAAAIQATQQPQPTASLDVSPAQSSRPLSAKPSPMPVSSGGVLYSLAVDGGPPPAFVAAVEAFTRNAATKEAPAHEYVPTITVPEDERPGRVPRYIKRSIARKFAERR